MVEFYEHLISLKLIFSLPGLLSALSNYTYTCNKRTASLVIY